jgi:threonine-phosphate decarboxylase
LEAIPGLHVFPSAANFLLVEVPAPFNADNVTNALRQKGFLIRNCSAIPGLNERTIRIAVKKAAQNRRVTMALQHFLEMTGRRSGDVAKKS